jgi:hypothetical protein
VFFEGCTKLNVKIIQFTNFEVRHPRCVSQITKVYSRRLKSKHNYIYIYICIYIYIYINTYKAFNLKVNRQLSREYFTSDAIYNGSAGMTLYYYTCRSWQDCCRRGENRSWPSVSVEAVDSECWCLNSAIFYAFIMRLTVEERVFILESYLKTLSYTYCRQSFFKKFGRQAPVKCVIAKIIKK